MNESVLRNSIKIVGGKHILDVLCSQKDTFEAWATAYLSANPEVEIPEVVFAFFRSCFDSYEN